MSTTDATQIDPSDPSRPPGEAPGRLNTRLTLITLAFLAVSVAALESVIVPALPLIQADLGLTPAEGALASVALTLTTVIMTPIAGRLADMYGARRTLLAVTAVVTAGGFVSAFTPVFGVFLLGQVLQGVGLGVLPIAFVVLRGLYPPERMKTATGVLLGMATLGSGVGVLLAGPVAEQLSRTAMYAVPSIGIAIAGLVFWLGGLARSLPRLPNAPTRVDWAGAALLALGLILLFACLAGAPESGWISLPTIGLLVAAAAVLALWVLVERRVRQPMVELAMLRLRGVWGSVVVGIAMGWAYAATVYLIPQQLSLPASTGFGGGAGPTQISLILFVGFAVAVVASPLAGRIAERVGTRAVAVSGLLLLGASAALLAFVTDPAGMTAVVVLTGIGTGATSTAVFAAAAGAVPPEHVGVSTALTTIARSLGAAIGTQLAASFLTTGAATPPHGAFQAAFLVAAGIAVVGVLLSRVLPRDVG